MPLSTNQNILYNKQLLRDLEVTIKEIYPSKFNYFFEDLYPEGYSLTLKRSSGNNLQSGTFGMPIVSIEIVKCLDEHINSSNGNKIIRILKRTNEDSLAENIEAFFKKKELSYLKNY